MPTLFPAHAGMNRSTGAGNLTDPRGRDPVLERIVGGGMVRLDPSLKPLPTLSPGHTLALAGLDRNLFREARHDPSRVRYQRLRQCVRAAQ